jgi:hypothetical protein
MMTVNSIVEKEGLILIDSTIGLFHIPSKLCLLLFSHVAAPALMQ